MDLNSLSSGLLIDQPGTVSGCPYTWYSACLACPLTSRGCATPGRSLSGCLSLVSWLGPYAELISGHHHLVTPHDSWVSFSMSQVGGAAKEQQSPCGRCAEVHACVFICAHMCARRGRAYLRGSTFLNAGAGAGRQLRRQCALPQLFSTEKAVALHSVW